MRNNIVISSFTGLQCSWTKQELNKTPRSKLAGRHSFEFPRNQSLERAKLLHLPPAHGKHIGDGISRYSHPAAAVTGTQHHSGFNINMSKSDHSTNNWWVHGKMLTISLVTSQCRLGESVKPKPNTRVLVQSKVRMSQRPPFSKPVISKACSEKGR